MQLQHRLIFSFKFSWELCEALEDFLTFESLFKILLVLSCVDAKQFGTSEGDKSQQPLMNCEGAKG
jgi:hypothetical protein